MKRTLLNCTALFLFLLLGFTSKAQDGSLDSSFSNDGLVLFPLGTFDDESRAIALQADGKIVVAGHSYQQDNYDMAVVRFLEDGSIDSTFNSVGFSLIGIGTNQDRARTIAIQNDGKIVIAGFSTDLNGDQMVVARLLSNGALDTSFDGDGLVVIPGGYNEYVQSIAIQTDGKIVVAGASSASGTNDVKMARLNENGSLDASFDTDGMLVTSVSPNYDDYAYSVKLQADGKIVVGGFSVEVNNSNIMLLRYNTNGSLDASFDGDGIVTAGVFGTFDEYGTSLAIQSDGKIILTGNVENSFYDFLTLRVNPDGNLDLSFGSSGIVYTDWGTGTDYGTPVDVAIQADGKVLVGGYHSVGSSIYFALVRYDSEGAIDSTFDGDGMVSTSFGVTGDAVGYALAIQPDGKILLAGGAYTSQNNIAIARYNNTIGSAVGTAALSAISTLTVGPNPWSESIQFEFGQKLKEASLVVYNSQGQVVRKIEVLNQDRLTLYRQGLSNGIYHFQLQVAGKIIGADKICLMGE
jgi:uncharacterized delta-60 repeat protein